MYRFFNNVERNKLIILKVTLKRMSTPIEDIFNENIVKEVTLVKTPVATKDAGSCTKGFFGGRLSISSLKNGIYLFLVCILVLNLSFQGVPSKLLFLGIEPIRALSIVVAYYVVRYVALKLEL